MEFTRPRGTRDFLFDEMRERKKAESILRNVFENYAYQEIKTPLFEEVKNEVKADYLNEKAGEEVEKIGKEKGPKMIISNLGTVK